MNQNYIKEVKKKNKATGSSPTKDIDGKCTYKTASQCTKTPIGALELLEIAIPL